MKNILNVLRFEYKGFVSAKSYRAVTIIFVALILVICFLPQIIGALGRMGVSAPTRNAAAVILLTGDAAQEQDVAALFTPDALAKSVGGTTWTDGATKGYAESDLKGLIANGKYDFAVSYGGGTDFSFYIAGSHYSNYSSLTPVSTVVTEAARLEAINKLPEAVRQSVAEISTLKSNPNVVAIGGNAQNNFWIGYVLMFLLFYMTMGYGQFVSNSIISEKTSKAMELLITAAKPLHLMVGKVIGVGLAALTQFGAMIVAAVIGIGLNLTYWRASASGAYDLITSSHISFGLAVFLILFFLLGFFMHSFMLAALASTVSRPEEAATIVTLPMVIEVAGFLLGFITLAGVLNPSVTTVLSYIPFFTPFVMTARFLVGGAVAWQAAIGVVVLFAGVCVIAWLAAKIYRTGVMMYGQAPKLRTVFKMLRQS